MSWDRNQNIFNLVLASSHLQILAIIHDDLIARYDDRKIVRCLFVLLKLVVDHVNTFFLTAMIEQHGDGRTEPKRHSVGKRNVKMMRDRNRDVLEITNITNNRYL